MSKFLSVCLILSLHAQIIHKLESSIIILGTFYILNESMLRISCFRLNQTFKSSSLSNTLHKDTNLSQYFKSQIFNTPNRGFVLFTNPKIPKHFQDKISNRLDNLVTNPIGITSNLIKDFFKSYEDPVISRRKFKFVSVEFNPISISQNFDELQVPLDHVSRDPSDTYYLDNEYVEKYKELRKNKYQEIINTEKNGVYDRLLIDWMANAFKHSSYKLLPTHTTSHIGKLLKEGVTQALYSGQVFRRDEIDSQHYPVFHQMDGYLLFTKSDLDKLREFEEYKDIGVDATIFKHLKKTLENLVGYLHSFVKFVPKNPSESYTKKQFKDLEKFWDDKATFPFTFPSSEFYLDNEGHMTEILGCGVLKNLILENNFPEFGSEYIGGWAFGIGLERLAMVLCKISDVRQFWETDERFINQYRDSYSSRVLPIFSKYSKNPPVVRDLSFYLSDSFDENLFREIIHQSGQGFVEDVAFVSSYFNEKMGKKSLCYRIVYRAFKDNLTNSFVNSLHEEAVRALEEKLKLKVR